MRKLPEHTRCKNCGECCGLIPASKSEIQEIRRYLKNHSEIRPRNQGIICPFRNNGLMKCDIYPVRPIICRLMGVTKGMTCKYGNSAEIDGHPFLPPNTERIQFLNFIKFSD